MMSAKLKWYIGFAKAVHLRGHSRHRTRKKNIHRVEQMKSKAFRRWGIFLYHPNGYNLKDTIRQ